jgi:hypothetical protein
MGYYINYLPDGTPLPMKGKAAAIYNGVPGAIAINKPTEWVENLVCVVENGPFDAAGYAHSPEEMEVFKDTNGRSSMWYIVPGARDLSGYTEAEKKRNGL